MSRLVGMSYQALILEAIREPLLDLVNEHPFTGITFTDDGVILRTGNQDYTLELSAELQKETST